MTWCNDSNNQDRGIELITSNQTTLISDETKSTQIRTLTCPSCGHNVEFQDQVISFYHYYNLQPSFWKFNWLCLMNEYILLGWNQWFAGITSWSEVRSEWSRDTASFGSKDSVWCAQAPSSYWWLHTNSWRRKRNLLHPSRKVTRCYFHFSFTF